MPIVALHGESLRDKLRFLGIDVTPEQLIELAWKLYVEESAGAMSALDFWTQLGPSEQCRYLDKASQHLILDELAAESQALGLYD